jgi:hypothetical protein
MAKDGPHQRAIYGTVPETGVSGCVASERYTYLNLLVQIPSILSPVSSPSNTVATCTVWHFLLSTDTHAGVPAHIPSTVHISSGLGKPRAITSWPHPSVDEYRRRIACKNDGTMPLEPYQRISQAVFEKWLKGVVDEDDNIDARFGWKVNSVAEEEGLAQRGKGVRAEVTDVQTGRKKCFRTRWLVGCDGASSIVRRSLGIGLEGGPV